MSWWRDNPELYRAVVNEVTENFPKLSTSMEGDSVVISGVWSVFGETRHIIDYDIKIVLPDDYPNSLPRVWETSGKIQKNPDRHFNPPTDYACLCAPPQRWEKWPLGASFTAFLDGLVKEFFFSQAYFDLKGEWIFGQWSHKDEGVAEYYGQKLQISNLVILKTAVELALQPKFFRQWKCPCDNKKRLSKCHGPLISELASILPKEEIKRGIDAIAAVIKNGKTSISI